MDHTHTRTQRLVPRHQVFLDLACLLQPDADSTAVETYLCFVQVARDALTAQQAFYDRYGLSEGKLAVLLLLRQAPEYRLTPSALADAAGVSRATITGLLSGLERAGLVTRAEHPDDGRMCTIALTRAALDLFEQLLPPRFTRIETFMSALTPDEQRQLQTLLAKMERRLPLLDAS